MSIPKFTAWASLGNYGDYSYINRKYKYDYDNSVKIEPAMQPRDDDGEGRDYQCVPRCRTQRCSYICGLGPPIERCQGTRDVCEHDCYYLDENGVRHGPFSMGYSYGECN